MLLNRQGLELVLTGCGRSFMELACPLADTSIPEALTDGITVPVTAHVSTYI